MPRVESLTRDKSANRHRCDIHGCSTALSALLTAIAPAPGDTIVTLGDYVDVDGCKGSGRTAA